VNPYEERLADCLQLRWRDGGKPGAFFSAENFRDFAERLDAWAASDPGLYAYFGGSSLTEKSHGQCNMAFFASRFGIEGLYLLDEPESALSPRKQLELRELLIRASQSERVQFIVATHSPILLSLPGASILSFDGAQVMPVALESTEHYRVYRDFFAARDRE
jgi:predicted ATPase